MVAGGHVGEENPAAAARHEEDAEARAGPGTAGPVDLIRPDPVSLGQHGSLRMPAYRGGVKDENVTGPMVEAEPPDGRAGVWAVGPTHAMHSH